MTLDPRVESNAEEIKQIKKTLQELTTIVNVIVDAQPGHRGDYIRDKLSRMGYDRAAVPT